MNKQPKSAPIKSLEFLAGGGMGERIRAFPWARTPLGEPQAWPQALRTAPRVLWMFIDEADHAGRDPAT